MRSSVEASSEASSEASGATSPRSAVPAPHAARRGWSAQRRRALVVVVGSALWVWLLAAVLPMVELGLGGWLGVLRFLVFPAAFALGLALDEVAWRDRRARWRRISEVALFGLAPFVLVAVLAPHGELVSREVLGPLHAALLTGATVVYLVAVAHLATTHALSREARPEPLPPSARLVSPRWQTAVRRALVGATTVGAIALVGAAPLLSGHAHRVARFGIDGAESAALLASVIGLAGGVVALGVIVAPALRARTASDRTTSDWRAVGLVVLAAVALAAWGWLTHR